MPSYAFYKNLLKGSSYPIALLDQAALDSNIQHNASRAGGKKIRIASKSIRCPEVMRYILDADSCYEGIMAYHPREAIELLKSGFDNILLGYPVVEDAVLTKLVQCLTKGNYICFMVDSEFHLRLLNDIGKKLSIQIPVCVDIDLSYDIPGLHFGVWRSGIRKEKDLTLFLDNLRGFDFIRLDGLMGYEAQVAGLGDTSEGFDIKMLVIRMLKNRSIIKIQKWRTRAIQLIREAGHTLRFINGGGTGSIESSIQEQDLTEVTVGSGFFNPHLFDYYKNFKLAPALFFALQIVRSPKSNIFTCQGGGFIASGAVEKTKAPRVFLPEGAKLDPNEGVGEVQTPMHYTGPEQLEIGDPILFRHAKAGELCEHFNQITIIENEQLGRKVMTYRGLGFSF